MQDSAISATVDFHQDGVQHGFLKLPYSHDQSAWGNVMIPVTVIRNGEGPTALLTGGNHGDEYEGITALLKLANRLQARDIRGRVIIVPMMNHPAVQNGTRTSPLDGGNLNRAFPGNPAGTLTEKIADYFTRYLVPLADVVLDMHSGGRTLDLLPFAATHRLADEDFGARCLAGAEAFGAPYTLFMAELEEAERERTGIAGLRVGYHRVFGYYLEIPKKDAKKVPESYHRKQTVATGERYITPELKEF